MAVIVVSGPPGAGSSTAAKMIADELNVDYFSPGKHFKEKISGVETEAANKGWKDKELSSESTHNSIDDLQKQVAKQGNVVIDGKLSIFMVGEYADVTVWLKAPVKTRAERAAQRDDMSFEEAKEMMQERQHEEVENWKEMYGFNYLDQEDEADLVVQTEDKTPEEVAALILSKI